MVKTIYSENYKTDLKILRNPVRSNDKNFFGDVEEPPLLNQQREYILKDILNYS